MPAEDLNVKVAVRCRPMSSKEVAKGCANIVDIRGEKGNNILIKGGGSNEDREFTFDHCYKSDCTQQDVYNDLGKPIVTKALDGFNGTIFAYGQTGSGKTFSMMGSDENKGIIPQLNDDLWNRLSSKINSNNTTNESKIKVMVTVSFLEVYNEEVKDLLNPSEKKLKIRESPEIGIFVEDLCELIVRDPKELLRLIYQGNAVRRVASTNMNDQSSRSHSVFTIKIEQKTSTAVEGGLTKELTVKAKVNLVDLAGSERADKTGATGSTLKEGANINKSLMALGNVINKLAEGVKKGQIVPYRDSQLTRLLQESLGGNSATTMIASISPADYNYLETVGTLKYANRAKSIANAVTRNEDSNERVIRELQNEIEALKLKLLAEGNHSNEHHVDPDIERKMKEMEESQMDAWREKERLSKALEEERQANVNNVISEMMHAVKDEKVAHMKNIKRLTNEKALVTKKFKEGKEFNANLKSQLDTSINEYQNLQKDYDDIAEKEEYDENDEESKRKHQEAELMANRMLVLLEKIENDRLKFTEKRDALKQMKDRLEKIEVEITDERAELVTTSGLLNQNDQIREQIQQEEREKMKIELEKEIQNTRKILAEERQNAENDIEKKYLDEMEQLRAEILKYNNILKSVEDTNNKNEIKIKKLEEDIDNLENELADSEVAQEFSQKEIEKLIEENNTKDETIANLTHELTNLHEDFDHYEREKSYELESLKENVEEDKFNMFKNLMDQFMGDRTILEQKLNLSQNMLKQAAKDIIHLNEKNQELMNNIDEMLLNEPAIRR